MSNVVLSLRTDTRGKAGSRRKIDFGEIISCRYGESLDGSEPCKVVLDADSPALNSVAVRDVIFLRNEIGQEYEYRVKRFLDSLTSPTVTIEADSILADLNDVLLSEITTGGETTSMTHTYSAANWWDLEALPALQRYGYTYFERGVFELEDVFTLTLTNTTVLGLLRQLMAGTNKTLRARWTGTAYAIDIVTLTVSYTARALVGHNVKLLDRDITTEQQATRIYPTGQTYPGGTPSTIAGTPWAIGAGVGLGVEILDPEFNTADFAIEDDQFAPSDELPGYAMVASRGTEINPVPATGSSTRWIESVCGAKRRLMAPIQNAAGELWAYDYVTESWLTPLTLGGTPTGSCYAPTQNKVYVTTGATGTIKVVDPDTLTVLATISAGTNVYHALYVGTVNGVLIGRVFVASAGGIKVIDPASNTIAATVTGGTSNALYQLILVDYGTGAELWGAGEVQHTKRYTVAATPAYIGEYDTGLESGAGSTTLCYDDVNDRVWLTYWAGNKLKAVTRSTGAIHTTFDTAVTPNAGPPRWLYAYGGTIYTAHTVGRLARWNGATVAYTSISTLDASGGTYWSLTPLAAGESSVVVVGDGRRVAWWDLSTHSARVIRRIAAVTAGSPSVVTFGGGTSVPFAPGDFTTLVTLDLLPVTSLPSPLAIAAYGEVQRPSDYPNARLVPNLVGHPGLDDWKTPGSAMANWTLPRPTSIGREEVDGIMGLALNFTFSGTVTAL